MSVGAALMFGAACGETGQSPVAPQRDLSPAARPSLDYNAGTAWGTASSDFILRPAGGTFSLGGIYSVSFPANSVCDPATSTYGPTEWDKPCVTLSNNQSVAVHATISLSWTGVAVDFTPHLRFAPDKQVTIYTDVFSQVITSNRDFFARYPQTLRPLAMYYTLTLGGDKIADYLTDPSAVTHVDLQTGRVWRRVKHFSGMVISTGEPCDPQLGDPDCIEIDGHDGP